MFRIHLPNGFVESPITNCLSSVFEICDSSLKVTTDMAFHGRSGGHFILKKFAQIFWTNWIASVVAIKHVNVFGISKSNGFRF